MAFKSERQRKAVMAKAKGFAREERATAKLYAKMGFKAQARDEAEHAKFFEKLSKSQVVKKS